MGRRGDHESLELIREGNKRIKKCKEAKMLEKPHRPLNIALIGRFVLFVCLFLLFLSTGLTSVCCFLYI